MIENFNDLLSVILLVTIPLIIFIIIIRSALKGSSNPEKEDKKQIEYYREW